MIYGDQIENSVYFYHHLLVIYKFLSLDSEQLVCLLLFSLFEYRFLACELISYQSRCKMLLSFFYNETCWNLPCGGLNWSSQNYKYTWRRYSSHSAHWYWYFYLGRNYASANYSRINNTSPILFNTTLQVNVDSSALDTQRVTIYQVSALLLWILILPMTKGWSESRLLVCLKIKIKSTIVTDSLRMKIRKLKSISKWRYLQLRVPLYEAHQF